MLSSLKVRCSSHILHHSFDYQYNGYIRPLGTWLFSGYTRHHLCHFFICLCLFQQNQIWLMWVSYLLLAVDFTVSTSSDYCCAFVTTQISVWVSQCDPWRIQSSVAMFLVMSAFNWPYHHCKWIYIQKIDVFFSSSVQSYQSFHRNPSASSHQMPFCSVTHSPQLIRCYSGDKAAVRWEIISLCLSCVPLIFPSLPTH